MSAMAEHDCIGTHQPAPRPHLGSYVWECPTCGHSWEWVAHSSSWALLTEWPLYALQASGQFGADGHHIATTPTGP